MGCFKGEGILYKSQRYQPPPPCYSPRGSRKVWARCVRPRTGARRPRPCARPGPAPAPAAAAGRASLSTLTTGGRTRGYRVELWTNLREIFTVPGQTRHSWQTNIQFHILYFPCLPSHARLCLIGFLIAKALLGAFNKEKALVGALSGHCETSRRFVDSSSAECALPLVPVSAHCPVSGPPGAASEETEEERGTTTQFWSWW